MSSSTRLPAAQAFARLRAIDQGEVVDLHLRQIDYEIDGLRTGYMWTSGGRSRAHHLKLLRARRRRLETLARAFGHWENAA